MRPSYPPWAVAAVAGLGALVVLATSAVALTLAVKVPVDPREGWNAYNTAAAVSGGQLYPGGLWFNNYPPLSYFVVGGLSAILGDTIVAGRIVALASTLIAAGAVSFVASRLQCNRFESLFAGLLFVASPWVLSKYAQMDDPQMFGQALGCAGFALIVWHQHRLSIIALGAFLLTLALFVKPMFVVQPLVLLVWLAIYNRKSAVSFAVVGVAACVGGLVLTDVLLRTDLVHDLLLSRVYSPSRMFSHPGQWLVSGLVPLAASLCLLRHRRDRYAMLCIIYVFIAVPFCLFFSGGEGVAGNATFDPSIACALGAAVFVNRIMCRQIRLNIFPPQITGQVLSPAQAGRSGGGAIIIACVLPLAVTFVLGMFGGWSSGPSIIARMKLAGAAQRDIAFVEARAGPALCEQPALCYWAGKPAQVDVWGLSQALATHARSEASLTALLDAHRFAVAEIGSRSALFHFATIQNAIARNYKIDHTDPLGTFLVPLTPDRT